MSNQSDIRSLLKPEELAALFELSRKLLALESSHDVLDTLVESSISILDAERGFLVEKKGDSLTFYRSWGAEAPGASEPVSRHIVADAIESQDVMMVADALSDPRYSDRASVREKQIRSVLAAPLDVEEDIVLYLETQDGNRPFGERQLLLFREILNLSAKILSNCARRLLFDESRGLSEHFDFRGFVARDRKTLELLKSVSRVAASDLPVLVQGPSGCGKELVIRALHRNSSRAEQKLIVVNCGAIAHALLESELFGHVRGAFTGATGSKEGFIASAHGGSVFLDEIGELSLDLQVKLLRTLQFGEVQPVGSSEVRTVDVRFLAATNRDLEARVNQGEFREDLFYRLNAITIYVPPLAARPDDVLPLFYFFLEQAATKENRPVPRITPELERALARHNWPGNVRELENEVKRILLMVPEGAPIRVSDLSSRLRHEIAKPKGLMESEKMLIEEHLRLYGGNRTKAAKSLGITREGLRKKMIRFRI
jgi:Nif-specific regulatory protein